MKTNPFKDIDSRSQKKTLHMNEEAKRAEERKNVVENIFEYVKVRIEMGIFEPLELTDVYSLCIYIGMVIPRDIDVLLNGKVVNVKQGDYIVFDFDENISHITKENFSSFYRHSKIAPYQQLLSAIRLFKITSSADEIYIKSSYNKTLQDADDILFGRLAEMIMNGNVDDKYIEAYKALVEEKYKNELINYIVLSDYKAQYVARKLSAKKIPFALISPLVDSIIASDDGEFDVEKVICARNNYAALLMTVASGAAAVAGCIAQMNKDLFGKAHCVDTLSTDELVAFKSQLDGSNTIIPGVNADKIIEQMKQEAIEEVQIYGPNDVCAKDSEDILK